MAEIPVVMKVLAQRDPSFQRVLADAQRDLELLGSSGSEATKALSSTAAADGLSRTARAAESAAEQVRELDQAARKTAADLKDVGTAGTRALGTVAGQANQAEQALQKTERASANLLATLKRVGMQSAVQTAMRATPGASPMALNQRVLQSGTMTLQGQVRQVNDLLEQVEDRYDQTARKAVDFGTSVGTGMMAAGAGIALVGGYAVRAAGEFEQLRAKLETVQKSAGKASQTFEFARELAAKTPFDVKGVVAAAVQLEVYGARAQEVLPLVADLAAGMGKDIESTALVVGKAMSGSLEGFESLRNEYGVSSAKLARYGAVMTATGSISVATAADLRKAQEALQRVVQTEFGGAVERQSRTLVGALSNAGDSVQNLAALWGEDLVPMVTLGARGFSSLVDVVGAIPGPMRMVGSVTAVVAAGVLGLGGAAVVATTALVAMNAQLTAAVTSGIPGVAAAAGATTTALTAMGAAAAGARTAMMFLATNPYGIALLAFATATAAGTVALNAYEEQQKKVGEQLTDESRKTQQLVQDWRAYWAARNNGGDGTKPGELPIDATPEQIREDIRKRSALDVMRDLAPGEDEASIAKSLTLAQEQAKKYREELEAAQKAEESLQALTADPRMIGTGEVAAYREQTRTPEQIRQLEAQLRLAEQNEARAEALLEKVKGIGPALQQALQTGQQLDQYLQFAGKAQDIDTMTEALHETQKALEALQKAAPKDLGLPVQDAGALRRRLLEAQPDSDEAKYIERLLTLMDEVQKQSERINAANKAALDERLGLMDEEYEAAQAGRDEDLQAEQRHLQDKLAAVRQARQDRLREMDEAFRKENEGEKVTAEQKAAHEAAKLEAVRAYRAEETRLRNEAYQNEEARASAQVASFRDAIEARLRYTRQMAAEGLRTASETTRAYRGILADVDRWLASNKALLDRFPELRSAVVAAKDEAAGAVARDVDAQVKALKQKGQGLLDGAGAGQQAAATRQVIDLYERALRTESAFQGKSQAAQERRIDLQNEINRLKKQEATLTEQAAEKERQQAQQMQALRLQVLDQDIRGLEMQTGGLGSGATEEQKAAARSDLRQAETVEEVLAIEARLAAGVGAEEQLAELRRERYEQELDLLEAEMQAALDVAGATEKEKVAAHERFLLRKRMLDEQERQRVLQALGQEVKAQETAEKKKADAKKQFNPEDRIGGAKSPIMSVQEAFSGGFSLGDFSLGGYTNDTGEPTMVKPGSKPKSAQQQAEAGLKNLGEAATTSGKSLTDLTPPAVGLGSAAQASAGSVTSLGSAAQQAAAALSALGTGGGGGDGDKPPPPPPTEPKDSGDVPGMDPAPSAPPPTPPTGEPDPSPAPTPPDIPVAASVAARVIAFPSPSQMGAMPWPRANAATNAAAARSEVTSIVNIDGLRGAQGPEVADVARAVQRLAQREASRQRVNMGPWA